MSKSALNPYHNNYASAVAFDAFSIAISAILLALRFYVRKVLVGKVGLDDWLLLATNITFWFCCALDASSWILVEKLGIDGAYHLSGKVGAASTQFYVVTEVLARWAYATFYLRVISSNLILRWHRHVVLSLVGIYTVYQIASFFLSLFQCRNPLDFGSDNPDIVCVSSRIMENMMVTTYSLDAFIDWIMVVLPIPVICKTKMSWRMKASVIGILSMGSMASISGILVIALSYASGPYPKNDMKLAIIIDILAQCEILTAIVCLSLAAMRPLFSKYLEKSTVGSNRPSQNVETVDTNSKSVLDGRNIRTTVTPITFESRKEGGEE